MESGNNLPIIDVVISAKSTCSIGGVSECCNKATAKKINELGVSSAAEAVLTLTCIGPNPDPDPEKNEVTCQAEITGELRDAEGATIAYINTTAQELADPQN